MTDNFLKHELEAEAKAAKKQKLLMLVVGSFLLLISSGSVYAWAQNRPEDHNNSEKASLINEPYDEASNQQNDNPEKQSGQAASSTPNSTQSNQAQDTPPQTYIPPKQSLNSTAYLSDGKTVMSAYNQIVGLVTFGSSMSDSEKASRIKQAVSLDKQSTGKVTNLRGHLVWANVSSGPYMDATELAESGVSKISVGLTFMNYWADDRSRTSDLQSGLGGVTEGSNILLNFSNKLNQL